MAKVKKFEGESTNDIQLQKERDYLELLSKRIEVAQNLMTLQSDMQKTYFKKDWIVKNILKIDLEKDE